LILKHEKEIFYDCPAGTNFYEDEDEIGPSEIDVR